MEKPVGTGVVIPPQDTPALEARAAQERDDLPKVPTPPDPQTYSYLGTVPPKPTLPTEAEIAGQVKDLAAEQAQGTAVIDAQADAPAPQVLPKPDAKSTSREQAASAAQDEVFSGNTNPFLPQSQLEQTDRLPADAP